MPAWSKARGGPLTAPQIASIIAYIKQTAGASPTPAPDTGSDRAEAVTPQ
jgi:mono/diheme cytochrome c family protein